NNRVGNFSNNGISTIYGIFSTGTTNTQITMTGDSIFNITSPGSTIYGIYLSAGFQFNISRNKINGLTSNTSTTAVVNGIYDVVATAGATFNIYNNFINALNTPASASTTPAIAGINVASGAANQFVNIYYNSVYLNSSSSSLTTFSTACLYALTTTNVDVRNNIFVNKSTAPGSVTYSAVAYRRSSTTIGTYLNSSNNNCLYSGTPGTTRLIYFDGTNSDQTIAAFKTRMSTRDGASFTEDVPFVNGISAPYDLRIQTGTPTNCESGGITVSSPLSITNDIYGRARYPNAGYPVGSFTPVAPDVGAYEFGGTKADNQSPYIFYSPLGAGGTTNRPFNNVIITDASGVNTTAGTKPRCYYKRSTDGNTINDNTNGTDGWKYVEANGTTSPFDFTIDYSLLNGGTGVIAGQTVVYFVIAQDLAGTPNVGVNAATFAVAPTTVALAVGNTPITLTNSYLITANSFSGSVNVGSAETYTNLTGASGLFQAINNGVLAGNLTVNITSDLVEDGTNQLNAVNESGVGGYTIKIVPGTTGMKTISGNVANGMIRLSGARRVVIDGNGGFAAGDYPINLSGMFAPPSKYLTFRNMNTANPVFTFINDAGRDSIKNCYIESANLGTASGAVLFSTTSTLALLGNDSISIDACDIRDSLGLGTGATFANGIFSSGTTTNYQSYNNYNSITNCNIYNNFYDIAASTASIYLNTGSTSWTISGNSFYQTVPRILATGKLFYNIFSASTVNNDINITNNYMGGSAHNCGGSPMTVTTTAASLYYAVNLSVGLLIPSSLQGNVVRNLALTSNAVTPSTTFFRAFSVLGYVNIGNIAGDTVGAPTGNNSIVLTFNGTSTSVQIICMLHTGIGDIRNNIIGSVTSGGNSTAATNQLKGIQMANTTPGFTYNVVNNLIGSLTTPNSMYQTDTLCGNLDRGFVLGNGAGTITNVINNTVANFTDLSTSTLTTTLVGISNAGAGFYNYSGNTFRNFTIRSAINSPGTIALAGITGTGAGQNVFTQNSVYSLYNTGSAGAQTIFGFFVGGTYGGTVSQNKVFDFKTSQTGSTPQLEGITTTSTGSYTITNNMVCLTNGDATLLNP